MAWGDLRYDHSDIFGDGRILPLQPKKEYGIPIETRILWLLNGGIELPAKDIAWKLRYRGSARVRQILKDMATAGQLARRQRHNGRAKEFLYRLP